MVRRNVETDDPVCSGVPFSTRTKGVLKPLSWLQGELAVKVNIGDGTMSHLDIQE